MDIFRGLRRIQRNLNANFNLGPLMKTAFVENKEVDMEVCYLNGKGHKHTKITVTQKGVEWTPVDVIPDGIAAWNPKSHMRDSEIVLASDDEPGTTITRSQGIGVIIVPACMQYIKLAYKSTSSFEVYPVNVWKYDLAQTRQLAKQLSPDIGLGYEVVVLQNGKLTSYCEPFDDRDNEKLPCPDEDDEEDKEDDGGDDNKRVKAE